MKLHQWLIVLNVIIWLSAYSETQYHDPQDDLGTLQFESGWGEITDTVNDNTISWWGYWTLPSIKIGSQSIFTALELDGLYRNLNQNGEYSQETFMRYGLFGGFTFLDFKNQKGSFLVGAGLSSLTDELSGDAWYVHLIYDHRVVLSDKLTIGLGILAMNNFGHWHKPLNLLPYVAWKISDRTRLRVAWDVVEVKQMLSSRFSVSAEARYDMSFFYTENDTWTEFQTVGAGGGFDVWLFNDYYLRVRYKELIFRKDILSLAGGETREFSKPGGGRSIKLQLVYAR